MSDVNYNQKNDSITVTFSDGISATYNDVSSSGVGPNFESWNEYNAYDVLGPSSIYSNDVAWNGLKANPAPRDFFQMLNLAGELLRVLSLIRSVQVMLFRPQLPKNFGQLAHLLIV